MSASPEGEEEKSELLRPASFKDRREPPPPPPASTAPAAGAPNSRTAVLAFFALVGIQVLIAVSYKAAQDETGAYPFSSASIMAVAELVKFWMSAAGYASSWSAKQPGGGGGGGLDLKAVLAAFSAEMFSSRTLPMQVLALAALYAVNNNLMFYVFRVADGANISIVKSGNTAVSALLLFLLYKRQLSRTQVSAIVLQSCGLIITQFGSKAACTKDLPVLPLPAYAMLCVSLTITAFTSVLNENVLKTSGASLHGINTLLYALGSAVNFLGLLASGVSPGAICVGFGSFAALACLLCNALIGIAVSAVYKYADAVVKTLASAVSTILLLIMFSLSTMNVVLCCGCVVVFVSVHLYISNPPAAAPAPVSSSSATKPSA